jgi:hypothetical protein
MEPVKYINAKDPRTCGNGGVVPSWHSKIHGIFSGVVIVGFLLLYIQVIDDPSTFLKASL